MRLGVLTFFAWLTLLAQPLGAADLSVGNLVSRAPGGGGIVMEIDGVRYTLAYGQFQTIDIPRGTRQVRVLDAVDGSLLATRSIHADPDARMTAVLFAAGNGTTRGYNVVHDQHSVLHGAPPADPESRIRLAVHHAAAFPEGPESAGDGAGRLTMQAACQTTAGGAANGASFTGALQRMEFGDTWRMSQSRSAWTCELALASAAAGGFTLSVEAPAAGPTRRVFMIGDGVQQPYQVLVLDGSEQAMLMDPPAPEARALAASTSHWFDLGRPDQGMALYELGSTGVVFGTWFTVDEVGRPTWFYLEGAAAQGVGRRDIAIYRASRATGAQALHPIASGRLQYLDCNDAEVRVSFDSGAVRTLRLRRGRLVALCPIFQ